MARVTISPRRARLPSPQVRRFYETHYRAGAMRLCVCGREKLDELQSLVLDRFKSMRDSHGETVDRTGQCGGLPLWSGVSHE